MNKTFWVKGTVSVISSDPPGKESKARFTKVLFQPLTVHRVERCEPFLNI